MADKTPTLSDLLATVVESYVEDLHVALPCKIQSYDATKLIADVQPQIKRSVTKKDGTKAYESFPLIPSVPIAFPRANDWFLSLPLQAGDFVFVVCSERSLEDWRATGTESEPTDYRMHRLDGAVAFPVSLYPSSNLLASVSTTNMVLGKDAGAKIYVRSDGKIHIGEATDFVAKATPTENRLDALESKVNELITFAATHAHTGVTTGLGVSGVAPGAPSSITPGDAVASSVAKVE